MSWGKTVAKCNCYRGYINRSCLSCFTYIVVYFKCSVSLFPLILCGGERWHKVCLQWDIWCQLLTHLVVAVLHACFLSGDEPPYVPLKSNKLGVVRWLCSEGTLCQAVSSSVGPSSLVVLTLLALLRSKKPRSACYPELGKGSIPLIGHYFYETHWRTVGPSTPDSVSLRHDCHTHYLA